MTHSSIPAFSSLGWEISFKSSNLGFKKMCGVWVTIFAIGLRVSANLNWENLKSKLSDSVILGILGRLIVTFL